MNFEVAFWVHTRIKITICISNFILTMFSRLLSRIIENRSTIYLWNFLHYMIAIEAKVKIPRHIVEYE